MLVSTGQNKHVDHFCTNICYNEVRWNIVYLFITFFIDLNILNTLYVLYIYKLDYEDFQKISKYR